MSTFPSLTCWMAAEADSFLLGFFRTLESENPGIEFNTSFMEGVVELPGSEVSLRSASRSFGVGLYEMSMSEKGLKQVLQTGNREN